MFCKHLKYAFFALVMALVFVGLSVPAFAAIPSTGDSSTLLFPVMGILLGVSLVLIIVFVILSAKKKKK